MYPWIWRHLPGPRPARMAMALLLALGVVLLLFRLVFPAIDFQLGADQVVTPGASA